MQDRGDLHSRPLTAASGSDTASIEASCNAAIAKKFLTDILANGPVIPLAPATTLPIIPQSPGNGTDWPLDSQLRSDSGIIWGAGLLAVD
jgi:hypothetical protein